MRLYTYFRSSASYRVRIGLAWKGVVYDSVPVHLMRDGGEQRTEAYGAVHPMQQVPVLEWENDGCIERLSQSLAILYYLEARWPNPPLFPSDVLARAHALELSEIVNAGVQPHQNTSTVARIDALGGDGRAYAAELIAKGLAAMERLAEQTASTFLVGDAVSVADVCLVPQLYTSRRFDVSLDPYPTLRAVEARCVELPAFASAHPERQPDYEPG